MILNDPNTGEAIFDTTPKSFFEILKETEHVYFGLFEKHMPELSIDELQDTFFPDGLTNGAQIKARIDQLAKGPGDWVVCALTAILFVNLASRAERTGNPKAAWSHLASACAWVNYGKGLATLPSATKDETKRRLGQEIADGNKRRQAALNDARHEGPREVKRFAMDLLEKRCPSDLWDDYPAAVKALLPEVLREYRQTWEVKKPAVRLRSWYNDTPEAQQFFKPKRRPRAQKGEPIPG
jgi:hypothetical protein